MIANTRPLYLVPHTGAAVSWQDNHYGVPGTAQCDTHTKSVPTITEVPSGSILASSAYATEIRSISSLPLSGIRAPGLLPMAHRYTHKELRMKTHLTQSQPSEAVQPSFAENVFLLLMLG
ncbi:MAG: hypothetical protein ACOVP2_10005 [Armatimonadaceae bacterium]